MQQAVLAAWAKDTVAGRSTVMTAADTATVSALNARAQGWHLSRGTVTAGPAAVLRGGCARMLATSSSRAATNAAGSCAVPAIS